MEQQHAELISFGASTLPHEGSYRRELVALLGERRYALSADREHLVLAVSDAAQAAALMAVLRGPRFSTCALLVSPHSECPLVFVAFPRATASNQLQVWLHESLLQPQARALTMGVSLRVCRADDLLAGVGQAVEALRWAQSRGLLGACCYESLELERLLGDLCVCPETLRFCHQTLGRLERYDAAHRSELLKTLETYFACNANGLQAARALQVHRNTMNNRLRRIAEIMQLDLAHPEARLTLQVALKIKRLCR